MCSCDNCGEETYRTHGVYSWELDGWYCFDCYDELKGEE